MTSSGYPSPSLAFRVVFTALAFGWAVLGGREARGAEAPVLPLRTAAEVLALPVEVARKHLPVALRGVVTAAEPDWQGKFFLQDASGGIFALNLGRQPAIGDVVEVEGVCNPGAFAPVINLSSWRRVGSAPLPPARQVTIERLMAGVEDGQRVEITGLVRSVEYAATHKTLLEVSIGAYRVRVLPKLPSQLNPQSLIAAKVRVRGTAGTSFNAARRQLTAVNLFVPTADDFVVEQPELNPPFEQPVIALDDVARYRSNVSLAERVHIKGAVTFQRVGQDLYLQDGTGGLRVESTQATTLPLGKVIEAVGFLEFVNFQPVLKDAVFRELAERTEPVKETLVPYATLRNGVHAAELIVLRGKLLYRSIRPVRRDNVAFAGVRISCTIQNADLTFTAEYEAASELAAPLATFPLGSTVEVSGIATLETGDDGKLKTLTLLLPEMGSSRLLATPSWFTAERLLVGLAVACVLLAAVAGWLLTVSKKNVMLSFLVAEREKAQKELQQAHDLLEARVKERTEQLKVEMTVRKTAELEFRAVLTERTRLARELHDTLEQTLIGISLQLDTALKLGQRHAHEANAPLELAREFLRQSQVELRRSIWDLRSRELEQFDLAEALAIGSRHIAAGAHIQVEIETLGERKQLPEIVEENLLRIAQEALTNVVKHAGATLVTIRLTYGADTVSLEVQDNGSGLITGEIVARGERQFGLLGMSERAKRLGGRLDVSSSPGEGTTVRVVVALEDEPRDVPLNHVEKT